jgi:hypothetical protein
VIGSGIVQEKIFCGFLKLAARPHNV